MMAAVHSRDTLPEKIVRSQLFRKGFRYRLHVRSLPGAPDIVMPRYRTVILVHGCFWHGHTCQRGALPKTNAAFWKCKLAGNVRRDAKNAAALKADGWTVVTIWTCQIEAGLRKALKVLSRLGPQRP
jgi:DNA mismatch endonuclease (patch repair protein)